ncbi:MAG: sulfite reductase subunit alpha [Actinomycetota bacterium]
MDLTSDPVRLLAAGGLLSAYGALCLAKAMAVRRRRRSATALKEAALDSPTWLVAYASQTGTAEDLAWQTARTLKLAGVAAHLCSLADLDADQLARADRILLVASTCGEGDAPDNGAAFAERLLGSDRSLDHLHYGLLSLGDSSYAHFCGFGRALDGWMKERGAQPLFEAVEVDRCDAESIENWRRHIGHLAGTADAPDWTAPAFADWRLVERRRLNPGSLGGPVYHLELEPADVSCQPVWESGDLAQISTPEDPDRPRDYSIASVPADGRIHLLVRQQRRPDGSLGIASGWLTAGLGLDQTVKMRLRPHRLFRLGENVGRPLILIGNGTGLAGLRAHLRARAATGGPNWLIYGERNAAHDFHYRDEIEAWRSGGLLNRLDLAFSRDEPAGSYVQDRLIDAGQELRRWMDQGAAIYVCGSRQGMAEGVDQALRYLLGVDTLETTAREGRYRRDIY